MTTDKQREAFETATLLKWNEEPYVRDRFIKGYQAAMSSPEVQKLVATAHNLEVMLGAARSTNWLNHAYHKPLEDLTEVLTPFTQKKEG